jgi:anti-sigma regulatory factor (Ser/Thr protein kinase)
MTAPTLSDRATLLHQALLYRSDREYAELAVPVLRDGLAVGDAVVVVGDRDRAALLRGRLGQDATRIEFVDPGDWFSGPMHALGMLHDRARAQWWPRGRLRLLTQGCPPGRSALETVEWSRIDSLINVLFAGTPSLIICAQDAAGGSAAAAVRTHPELLTPDGPRPSDEYMDPAAYYAACNATPLPAPPADRSVRRAFASGGLPSLRDFLDDRLAALGVPSDLGLRFVLAVNEVATNIIRHGSGRGSLCLWTEPDELVCDVTDPARRLEDRFLGYFPPRPYAGGAGMWAVRRLCHIVEIRSGATGTVIRLHVRLR